MRNRLIPIVLVALIAPSTAAFGEAAIETKADSLMKAMTKELESAQSLAFTAETTVDEVFASGQKVQRGALVSVLVRRPDRVFAVRDGDTGIRKFAFDGKTITVHDPELDLFATAEAPGTIEDALAHLREEYDLILPLGDLIQSGLYEEIRPRVTSGRYLGRHRVDRVPCHHLAFTMDNADFQIWIEDGEMALPRKIVITYKNVPQSPQFTAVIGEWRLGDRISDEALQLVVPAGASRIEIRGKENQQ